MPTNDELWTKLLEVQDRLDQIEKSRSTEVEQIPELEDDPAIPRVGRIQLLGFNGSDQLDEVIIGFEEPRDAFNFSDIEAYELYTKGNTSIASELIKAAEVRRSPFVMPVVSNLDGVVTFAIRTRMKGGLGTPVETSPTIAVDIGALRAAIAAGSVGTTELANNAVTTQKLDNLAVTNAKIANLAVGNAQIQNLAVNNAKIQDLAATKITAGLLQAGVIYTGLIEAAQINAGTINSVNINAGTYSLTSGANQMTINGSVGFEQTNSLVGTVQIINGGIGFKNTSNQSRGSIGVTVGGSQRILASFTTSTGGSGILIDGGVSFPRIQFGGSATLQSSQVTGFPDFEFSKSVYPSVTNSLNMGLSTRRWDRVYSRIFNAAGTDGVSGSFTTTDLKTVTVTNGIITAIV